MKPRTIAKSLAIGDPADGPYALDLARRTNGSVDAVDDDEIRAGIELLAETTGIFTETAGGVTTAVLAPAPRAAIGADERVVAVITGDGLKTLDAVREVRVARDRTLGARLRLRTERGIDRRPVTCRTCMAVTVKIPPSYARAEIETAVDGAATVGEVLDGLYERYDGRATASPRTATCAAS